MSRIDAAVARAATSGEYRAGGTDIAARQHIGRTMRPYVDLHGIPELRGIQWRPDGSARIGALTTVATLATDAALRAGYPALAAAAGALATPQIRTAGTLGGNLLQRNRCWYYRNPLVDCFQSGGHGCPAREGTHLYSAVIDLGPCVAPHPSTIAVALLAYGARLQVHGREHPLPVADLYGDGTDPTRDHQLSHGELLVAVELPAPATGERAAYHRTIARAEAEWPLVEAVARLVLDGPTITEAAVAVGGVARIPLRLAEVEAALVGASVTAADLRAAVEPVTGRCTPLPQTGYKVTLLRDTILEVLEQASGHSAGS